MTKFSMMFVHNNKHFLAVSRKNDLTKFGLPGGAIDPGETPMQAAIRETFEETGIVVEECVLVHATDDSRYFFATKWSGEIDTKEVGIVKWGVYEDFVNKDAAFPANNIAAFAGLTYCFPEMKL